jgi:hypothetical protein
MWYSSPSNGPQQGRVSPNQMTASVREDPRPTGSVAVAEISSERDFAPNAIPGARPGKAMAAAAGATCPGTEYWLP